MLMTITAGLLIGATTGLIFNVRMVLHLSLAALTACGLAALLGLASPAGAALYAIAVVVALQVGYFVSLLIAALGLTREPVADEAGKPSAPLFFSRSKRPRV